MVQWRFNNNLFKADRANNYFYDEFPEPMTSYRLFHNPLQNKIREVTQLPEAMGYVTKARTLSVGAALDTGGAVKDSQNMTSWFNKTHSAEWRWRTQITHVFWEKLMEKLELKLPNP